MDSRPLHQPPLPHPLHHYRHRVSHHLRTQVGELLHHPQVQLHRFIYCGRHGVQYEDWVFGDDLVGVFFVDLEGSTSLYVYLIEPGFFVGGRVLLQLHRVAIKNE